MLESALRLKRWATLLRKSSEDSSSDESQDSQPEVTQKAGDLVLPSLPYKAKNLQDLLSGQTLDEHLRIHKQYVDKTRELVAGTKFADMELDDVVRAAAKDPRSELFRNAAQAWNHAFYWMSISPPNQDTAPSGALASAVDKTFGDIEKCRDEIIHTATQSFGSAWIWLVVNDGDLNLLTTPNASTPLQKEGLKPLLCLDLWEHAYFLDYKHDRTSYIDSAVKQLLNWGFAEQNWDDQTGW